MNIVVEELGPCRRKLTVEVPREEVSEAYASVLGEFARVARIKGFRPGKAPEKVVNLTYGKQIRQEVKDRLIPEGYRSAVKQESLNPVQVLDVTDTEVKSGEPFQFSITCDVAPVFNLPDYSDIEVETRIDPVGDEDVERTLVQIREQFATFNDVDRAVEPGDLVQIDFDGTIDGVSIAEVAPGAKGLDSAREFWVLAGEQAFLPEFGEKLIGTRKEDRLQIEVNFAEDFHDEDLRGKTATYDVTVHAVREKVVPDLAAEQLTQLGVESEEMLRDRVTEDLERRREGELNRDFRNQVLAALGDQTQLDLPESVVEDETRRTIYDMVQQATRSGVSAEEVEERKDALFDQATLSAKEKVKIRYILAGIAEKESIEVDAAEVDRRIEEMARGYQSTPDEVRQTLQKNDQLENLHQDLRFEKTLDFLLEQAKVKPAYAGMADQETS